MAPTTKSSKANEPTKTKTTVVKSKTIAVKSSSIKNKNKNNEKVKEENEKKGGNKKGKKITVAAKKRAADKIRATKKQAALKLKYAPKTATQLFGNNPIPSYVSYARRSTGKPLPDDQCLSYLQQHSVNQLWYSTNKPTNTNTTHVHMRI